ncbi:YceI family protein [Erythrobacter sp. SCSIO 43205]|uniref:YceI family protein n=1 Tax=Erythrobacter sp. SCSIO 43205 TaxID=2779361 RepID=UPI001CA89A52|nr:YceI family protein [Erythrobacter sp. SCSIO 43205]UAB77890.1 YceI family protein [Erythrobacter sp. SCSIO 43205]
MIPLLKRALWLPLFAVLLAANASAPVNYRLDEANSLLSAKVPFFGIASKTATFPKMRGTATIVGNNPSRAAIDVTFDATALTAPDDTTLGRLKGEKFFWVERHPSIRFKGRGLTMTSATKGTITGQLTARGVTRNQSLNVSFDRDPLKAGPGEPIAFTANAEIDRRNFGMKSYQLIVGNTVEITFDARIVPN